MLAGLAFVFAPNVAGDTAITDPVILPFVPFSARSGMVVLVPPLLHLLAGGGLRLLGAFIPSVRPRSAALIAVTINGVATAAGNAYGAGVMGVGLWLIGSLVSVVLMFVGIAVAGLAIRGIRPG